MIDLISKEEVLNLIDTAFENGAFDGRYAYENLIDAVQNLIHPLETDLVSRQAAIDILDDLACDYESGKWDNSHSEARGRMINLPSVEPEKSQCSWYGEDGRCHFAEQEMDECDDCISRQAAIDTITHELSCGAVVDQCGLETAYDLIKDLPPAQPQRKIGHWILKHRTHNVVNHYTGQDEMGETHTISVLERYEVNEPYCSECGKLAGDTSQDYCCACGAKMEEVKADADSN